LIQKEAFRKLRLKVKTTDNKFKNLRSLGRAIRALLAGRDAHQGYRPRYCYRLRYEYRMTMFLYYG